jgi:hypothetical protein
MTVLAKATSNLTDGPSGVSLLVSELVKGPLGFSRCELCCEKLVAEAGDSSGTQKKGNVRRWKPLPSDGSDDVAVDTSVCV